MDVFPHTDEGVPLRVSVTDQRTGEVAVTVEEGGPGFPSGPPSTDRPAPRISAWPSRNGWPAHLEGTSTGGTSALGGARVTLVLGPAAA